MIAMYIPKVSPKYIPEKQPGAPERTAHPLAGLGALIAIKWSTDIPICASHTKPYLTFRSVPLYLVQTVWSRLGMLVPRVCVIYDTLCCSKQPTHISRPARLAVICMSVVGRPPNWDTVLIRSGAGSDQTNQEVNRYKSWGGPLSF